MTEATTQVRLPAEGDPAWFQGFPYVLGALVPGFHPATGIRADLRLMHRPEGTDAAQAAAFKDNPNYGREVKGEEQALRWLSRAELQSEMLEQAVLLSRTASDPAWRVWAGALRSLLRDAIALPTADGVWVFGDLLLAEPPRVLLVARRTPTGLAPIDRAQQPYVWAPGATPAEAVARGRQLLTHQFGLPRVVLDLTTDPAELVPAEG